MLGALALFLTDSTVHAASTAGQSPTAAAALSALDQFLDRPTVDQVRRVVGLTPSGAVRLIDRLADEGLVSRGPGADGRSRSVTLTARGRRLADRIRAARAEVLDTALRELTPAQRSTLYELTSRVLASLVRTKVESGRLEYGGWTCRMCDLTACGRGHGNCPAADAAAKAIAQIG